MNKYIDAINNIYDVLNNKGSRRIAIYGCGVIGKEIKEIIEKEFEIVCFIDQYTQSDGYGDIPIVRMEQLKFYPSIDTIIISVMYDADYEIQRQLQNRIDNLGKNIFIFRIRDITDINHIEFQIASKIYTNKPIKVIIGADGTSQYGWISTDINYLNLLIKDHWERYFSDYKVSAIIAEHVLEHLHIEEIQIGLRHCYEYLKDDGYIRIAVPDGFSPSKEYIEAVRPNGIGPGSDDHKVLLNYKLLNTILTDIGFCVDLLEYYDENGDFIYNEWDPSQGFIRRTKRFDKRNQHGRLVYTSLLLDAYKCRR